MSDKISLIEQPEQREVIYSSTALVGIYRNKSLHIYILLTVFIVLTLLALFLTSIRPTDVKMNSKSGSTPINLPLKEHSDLSGQTAKEYDLTGKLAFSFLSQRIVAITADGCIKYFRINGITVTRDKIVHGENCNFPNRFDINLGKYLTHGTNTFEIALIDSGKWVGLSINNSYPDKLYVALISMLMLEMTVLLYYFLKNQLPFPRGVIILIVLGVLIRILYLSYTPYDTRSHDVLGYGGHLDYIKYVANHFQLPNPDPTSGGWEYHQAPLYYITAAPVYKISHHLAFDYLSLLQVLSLAYFTVFLIFGVLIFQRVCKSQWLFLTCTALLVFWPSAIIHSIRIGNDVMYYMLSVIGLYFLIQWIAKKQEKHFYLAALFVALTVATKLSGLIWIAILVCFFLLHMLKKQHSAACLKQTLFLISVLGCALFFGLDRNVTATLHDPKFDILEGTTITKLSRSLSVGNNVSNFLYFDVHTYITKPWADPENDAGGRQYFWNYFLKTMLFGQFSFSSPKSPFLSTITQFLATILSLVSLPMIFFFFIGFILSIREISFLNILLLLWIILPLFSLIIFRHTYPFSVQADFRFIFPTIIPFIYFCVSGAHIFVKSILQLLRVLR